VIGYLFSSDEAVLSPSLFVVFPFRIPFATPGLVVFLLPVFQVINAVSQLVPLLCCFEVRSFFASIVFPCRFLWKIPS
jgi:hypothetical protein